MYLTCLCIKKPSKNNIFKILVNMLRIHLFLFLTNQKIYFLIKRNYEQTCIIIKHVMI